MSAVCLIVLIDQAFAIITHVLNQVPKIFLQNTQEMAGTILTCPNNKGLRNQLLIAFTIICNTIISYTCSVDANDKLIKLSHSNKK